MLKYPERKDKCGTHCNISQHINVRFHIAPLRLLPWFYLQSRTRKYFAIFRSIFRRHIHWEDLTAKIFRCPFSDKLRSCWLLTMIIIQVAPKHLHAARWGRAAENGTDKNKLTLVSSARARTFCTQMDRRRQSCEFLPLCGKSSAVSLFLLGSLSLFWLFAFTCAWVSVCDFTSGRLRIYSIYLEKVVISYGVHYFVY